MSSEVHNMNKLKWSKAIKNASTERKIIGIEIEKKLHEAGIVDGATLKANKNLASRIIAQAYNSEVHQLQAWAESPESVPEIVEPAETEPATFSYEIPVPKMGYGVGEPDEKPEKKTKKS